MLLDDIVTHLDRTLEVQLFKDYGPNGLQVEGRREVTRVVTGVSANLALIEAAVARGAQLIVVHHGVIWGGGLERVTGPTARRLAALLSAGISLAAYHLPLDKHPRLGNNAGLADALRLGDKRSSFGPVRGHELGLRCELDKPLVRAAFLARVREVCRHAAPIVLPHGPETVARVGICTGAASDLLEAAAAARCDTFVSGELAERSAELARELGVTLVGAGHHATEIYGPMRLAEELRNVFGPAGLDAEFVDVPSPL
jgi:dinuclear metal center YbgI/SA1388 family protein